MWLVRQWNLKTIKRIVRVTGMIISLRIFNFFNYPNRFVTICIWWANEDADYLTLDMLIDEEERYLRDVLKYG